MGFLFDKDTHRSTLPVRTISCPRRRNMLCMRVISGKFSCTAGCAACHPSDAPPRCLPGHCLPVLRPGRSTACRSAVCRSCGPAGALSAGALLAEVSSADFCGPVEVPSASLAARRSTACRSPARRSCGPAGAPPARPAMRRSAAAPRARRCPIRRCAV